MNRINLHISYVFFETDEACENLTYFLNSGLDENCLMTLVVKDPNGIRNENLRKLTDNKWNVKVFNTENIGYDFRGYLDSLNLINFEDYQYFILMNAGNIGPFYKGDGKWYDIFIEKLNDKIKVVATNACIINGPRGKYKGPITYNNKRNFSWGGWFCFADRIGIKILYNEYKKYDITQNIEAHVFETMNGNIIRSAGYDFTGLKVVQKSGLAGLAVGHKDPYKAIIFKRKYNPQINVKEILAV